MADRVLSIYDARRRWLGSWTIPPKVRALDVLRDMLASVPKEQWPVYYATRTGQVREVKL